MCFGIRSKHWHTPLQKRRIILAQAELSDGDAKIASNLQYQSDLKDIF